MRFLDAVEGSLALFEPDPDDARPDVGNAVLRALGYSGRLRAWWVEQGLAAGGHPLSPLFFTAHDVLTEVRRRVPELAVADLRAAHARWVSDLNRGNDEAALDSWAYEQCGACLHWVPLAGTMGADWGVCSNPLSRFDRRAMFEHDGCERFVEDPEGWRTPDRA